MKKEWPVFKRFEIQNIYNKFSDKDKKEIEDFLQQRRARGLTSENRVQDVKRYISQCIYVMGQDYKNLSLPIIDKQIELDKEAIKALKIRINKLLDDISNKEKECLLQAIIEKRNIPLKIFIDFLVVLKSSKLEKSVKNDMKCYFRAFLKTIFSDWSTRFSEFEDVVLDNEINEKKINHANIYADADIDKLVKCEPKTYWRAFTLVQAEGALRTKETRFLPWEKIKFNVDGDISEIEVYATKTRKARTVYVQKATYFLKKLKEEQENIGDKGVYIFHAKKDKNKPINKGTVNEWFKKLSQKALGKPGWPYLLRHSTADRLYGLARENKISRDVAKDFMGHSKDMSYRYDHTNPDRVKKMLKDQIFHLENLPPEKKAELQALVEKQQKEIEKQHQDIDDIMKNQENFLKFVTKTRKQGELENIQLANSLHISREQLIQIAEIVEKIREKK